MIYVIWYLRWESNPQAPEPKSGGFASLPTEAYMIGRGSGIRTHVKGLKAPCYASQLHPRVIFSGCTGSRTQIPRIKSAVLLAVKLYTRCYVLVCFRLDLIVFFLSMEPVW